MISALHNLFSWSFLLGMVVGFVLNRAWHLVHCVWLEKHRPLSGGRHRSLLDAIRVDPRAVAAVVMIAVVSWSVFKTQENADRAARITAEAQAFSAETRDCQAVLIQAIIDRAKVTAEYNRQSDKQRDSMAAWLRTLLDPPPEIAALDGTDPVRQRWAVGVTKAYFEVIQQSQQEQAVADANRPALPDPDCHR